MKKLLQQYRYYMVSFFGAWAFGLWCGVLAGFAAGFLLSLAVLECAA